jgi:hypothetical protein
MHTTSQASRGLVQCRQLSVLALALSCTHVIADCTLAGWDALDAPLYVSFAGAGYSLWRWARYSLDEPGATSLGASSAPPERLVGGADAWIGLGF